MYYFFLFQDSLGKDFEDIDSCSTGDNDDDIFIESDQVEGCFDGKEEYLENTIDNSDGIDLTSDQIAGQNSILTDQSMNEIRNMRSCHSDSEENMVSRDNNGEIDEDHSNIVINESNKDCVFQSGNETENNENTNRTDRIEI
jgi:hypothetical protein